VCACVCVCVCLCVCVRERVARCLRHTICAPEARVVEDVYVCKGKYMCMYICKYMFVCMHVRVHVASATLDS